MTQKTNLIHFHSSTHCDTNIAALAVDHLSLSKISIIVKIKCITFSLRCYLMLLACAANFILLRVSYRLLILGDKVIMICV